MSTSPDDESECEVVLQHLGIGRVWADRGRARECRQELNHALEMSWRIIDEPGGQHIELVDFTFNQLFDHIEQCAQRLGVAPLADLIEQFFVRNRDETEIVMKWDIGRRSDLLVRRLRMSEITIANRRFDLARRWLQACRDEATTKKGNASSRPKPPRRQRA
jgi:hypothetical protein